MLIIVLVLNVLTIMIIIIIFVVFQGCGVGLGPAQKASRLKCFLVRSGSACLACVPLT